MRRRTLFTILKENKFIFSEDPVVIVVILVEVLYIIVVNVIVILVEVIVVLVVEVVISLRSGHSAISFKQ